MTNSKNSDKERAFFKTEKVDDPWEVRKLLIAAAEQYSRTVMWVTEHEGSLKTQLLEEIGKDQLLRLKLNPQGAYFFQPEPFRKFLEEKQITEIFLRIYFKDESVIGVKAPIHEISQKAGYVFTLPLSAAVMQRRKFKRYVVPGAYEFSVLLPNPHFPQVTLTKRLIDISNEGFSFFIQRNEKSLFKAGQLLPRAEFTLKGHRFEVGGEIRSVREYSRPRQLSGYQVGVKILRMEETDGNALDLFLEMQLMQFAGPVREYEKKDE